VRLSKFQEMMNDKTGAETRARFCVGAPLAVGEKQRDLAQAAFHVVLSVATRNMPRSEGRVHRGRPDSIPIRGTAWAQNQAPAAWVPKVAVCRLG